MKYLMLTSSIIAMSVMMAPSIATAQTATEAVSPNTASAPADTEIGEIVVTAQRRSESINRVPLSIQAFSGERLANAGVTDASSLPMLTSGLNFARSSANTPIYTMRGVGFNTPNLSSTSPVGAYYNEVALPYPYMTNGPIYDLERVEVLKGPQGTLYGRNTTGGLINFITSKPGNKLEAGLTSELGNYKTYNFEGYISGPITDTLGIRIAGRWENSDKGWQKSVTRDDTLGKKDRLALRGTLVWNPTDRLALDITASYWRDRSDTIAAQAILLTPDQPAFVQPGVAAGVRADWTSTTADWDPFDGSKPAFRTDSEFYGVSGRLSYKLTDTLSVISLTSYNHVKRNDLNDVDGTAQEVFSQLSTGSIGSFSEELRLAGETDRLNYTVGGYYSVDNIDDNQIGFYEKSSVLQLLRFLAQNVIDPTNSRYSAAQYATGFRTYRNTTEQRSRSASLFGSFDYKLTDTFKVSAGLRYTDDQLRFSACSGDLNGNTLPIWNTSVHFLVNVQSGATPNFLVQPNGCMTYAANFTDLASFSRPTLNQNNLAGRLSAQFTPNSNTLIYATFSRGYKSGAVPMLPTNVETQLDPARQEKLTAYEVGTKLSLANRMVQLNVAGFYYDYRNKQLFSEVLDPVFTTLTRLVNVPKSRVYGAEVDLDVRPNSNINLHLGAAFTNTKVQTFSGFNRAGQATNFAGASFPYSPKYQLNGSITYDTPISEGLGIAANLDANYQSKTSGSIGEETGFDVAGYTVVNAALALHSANDKWRVGFYAKNLFNKYYWTSVDVLTDTVFRTPGMARTYGVRLSWKY
jgi:iron complex outermembrane recepter protein